MALAHSPSIVTDGLVLNLDAKNYKSFKGIEATNLLYEPLFRSSDTDTTNFKLFNGTERVYIPQLGYKTAKYVSIYNNYPDSGNCCPSPFDYGGNVGGRNIVVSSNTAYTYQIIYKTTSEYTNENFMYRYEYSGGTYVGEAGVHSNANRTSLGDGWWFAWGQFTTGSTTDTLWLTGLWYYNYGVYDKIYVAGVSLHQGTTIIPPEHMLSPREVRSGTWTDLSGNNNNGTLVNGVGFSTEDGGSLEFDGVDDYVTLSSSQIAPGTGAFTWNFWVKLNDLSNASILFSGTGSNSSYGVVFLNPTSSGLGYYALGFNIADNNTSFGSNWWYITFVGNGGADGSRNLKLYRNTIQSGSTFTNNYNFTSTTPIIGANHSFYAELMRGNIANVSYYNRALTAQEIQQNFNALRGRYGI
jgi:hypothetical protein